MQTKCSASGFYVRMPALASAAPHACILVLLWLTRKEGIKELTTDVTWTILTMSLLQFFALNEVVALLSIGGQKALEIHQKYLNLCFEDEQRCYGFGTTWGCVINDRICYGSSAVKWLITMNRIQNKSFCLHNISVCTVYIYYVYINTHTCMYIFKKNMLCLYIKYMYII